MLVVTYPPFWWTEGIDKINYLGSHSDNCVWSGLGQSGASPHTLHTVTPLHLPLQHKPVPQAYIRKSRAILLKLRSAWQSIYILFRTLRTSNYYNCLANWKSQYYPISSPSSFPVTAVVTVSAVVLLCCCAVVWPPSLLPTSTSPAWLLSGSTASYTHSGQCHVLSLCREK